MCIVSMHRCLALGVRTATCIRRIRPWEKTCHFPDAWPSSSWAITSSATTRHTSLLLLRPRQMSAQSIPTEEKKKQGNKKCRQQILRQRRQERHQQKQEKDVREAIRLQKDVPLRSKEDFGNFFDAIMPLYSLSRVDELLNRIQSKAQISSDYTPLPLVLQTTLENANTSDDLQIHVLKFLMYNDQSAVTQRKDLPVDPGVVDTLILAREKAIYHPLFWNKDDLRRTSQDAERILAPLQRHEVKTETEINAQALEIGIRLRNRLPPKYFKALMTLLENYVGMDNLDAAPSTTTLEEKYEPERVGRPPIRLLGPSLYEAVGTHMRLVGHDVACFFYLAAPETDPGLIKSAEQWSASRDKFSTVLAELQDKNVKVITERKDLFREDEAKPKKKKQTRRPKKTHFRYHVTVTDEEMKRFESESVSSTIVFLDNLPIDVSEEEIQTIYSRCGPIKSVNIFNQRPDLDPGPLTTEQIKKRMQRQLKSVSAVSTTWQRPKTPVYALVEFVNEEGYNRAIDDTLRIFGVLIRRHPVRSTASTRLNTLYLEDFTEGEGCLELEYELERALKVQVSVASGQDAAAPVGSCEISFPSFNVAWKSFMKLQDLQFIQRAGGKVNWFPSQRDAVDWWTRKRGFDY